MRPDEIDQWDKTLKEGYLKYFLDLKDKLSPNGCFTAHNVLWSGDPHIKKFLDYVKGDPDFRTVIERGGGEGISVSCRDKNLKKPSDMKSLPMIGIP